MSFLAQGQRDVLSIESPVHWTIEGVRQVEAESGAARAAGSRPTLRAMVAVRPDVLMVSAVPDHGTAIARDAARLEPARRGAARRPRPRRAGSSRLRELGVPPAARWPARSASSPASGSSVRSAGSAGCRPSRRRRRRSPPTASTRDEARGLSFFKGKGCPTCNTIGYRGRRAIFETIPASARGALRWWSSAARSRRSSRPRSTAA